MGRARSRHAESCLNFCRKAIQLSRMIATRVRTRTSSALAPSPRVFAHLLRRGKIPASSMAVAVVEPAIEQANHHHAMVPPPNIVTTPCDPWPRPYYLEDGLRRVAPYHFTYNTNVKERWRGRGILDIFRDEFRDRPEEYYVCPPYM